MFAFLKLRTMLAATGLMLIALLIWYGGPYLGFGDARPLESTTVRLVLIAIVIVGYVVALVLKRLRAASASDKLMSAVVKQSSSDKAQPSAEAVQLRERFEEAVATLKQKRRGSHTLYELPWYVIIGAPGSGKTTALVNSGLKFPIEQRSGKGALRGVGGTRNCDWWFTDEAVFLDTAGRYTTQDSDASADSAGWSEFLALLRKYRKRRPVNGVILTISAQDLMTQGHAGREAHVAAARRRLDELNRELRIQLPVYLMVTKCDLVAGFNEYFDDMPADARAQVWGVTFPYGDTLKGQAAPALPGELDALNTRLNERLLARVEEDRDVKRRTKIFGFPHQMAALRDPLSQFVSEVFGSTRFDKQILLRGVYFTSGTQEGTPIDRLLGAMVRRFAVAPEAVAPGRGKAYFIERLLKDVMFAESGLAGVNRRIEVQKAALQLGAYAAMMIAAVVGVIALWVSYARNRDYLTEVAADVARLSEVPSVDASASLDSVLYRLNEVRTVVDSANRYEASTPLAMRWGLFQGRAIGNAARDAYTRELNDALLPRVAGRFRQRLIEYTAEPEKLYEYLKGYLMFGTPDRLDPEQLGLLADYEWDAAYPGDPDLRAAASSHFHSLLENEDTIRAIRLDDGIVTQARSTIRQASLPGLVYRYLRLDYANDTGRALRLDLASGLGAERVLSRRSGVSLSEPVPSLYTKPVFKEVTERGTEGLVKQFSAEQWVWGDAGPSFTGSAGLGAEVLDVYEKDYIAAWDRIVSDLELVPFSGLERTREALAILAGDTSPLRGFLKVVDDNTFLVEPPNPGAARGRGIGDRVGGIINRGRQALGIPATGTAGVAPGLQVTQHFAALHRLVTGDGGKTQLDAVLGQMQQIQQKLQAVGTGIGQDTDNVPVLASIGEMSKSLQRDAAALPPEVGALVNEVGSRTAAATRAGLTGTLTSRYQEDVLRPCRELVTGRFPFTPTSVTDVQLADFGRVFGYNGIFDTFYRDELEELVDRTRRPWRWRTDASGASVGGGFDLSQFELAQRIRDVFFRQGSQDPGMRFTLTPVFLDPGAGRFTMDVDGQMLDYRYGPERPVAMTWPGPNPNAAAASFQQSAGQPNLVAEGPWAWFRLIAAAELARETDTRYLLTIRRGAREARVRVDAATVLNPMASEDWQRFRCG